MLNDQEKNGSGGGTRTPDTRIMIPPAERGATEENQSYQALAPADKGNDGEHAGNAPGTKAGTADGAQGRNPISAESCGSGPAERQSAGDRDRPGSVGECLSPASLTGDVAAIARDRAAAMTTAELVEYLRTRPADYRGIAAADRLEQLEAECERLRGLLTHVSACARRSPGPRAGATAYLDPDTLREIDGALGE